MKEKEILHYFLDPWYYASKEEAEGYLLNAGIDPGAVKREFKEFIDAEDKKRNCGGYRKILTDLD